MAQKKSRKSDGASLAQLQKQIERLDRELVRIANERAKVSLRLEQAGADGSPSRWEQREAEFATSAAASSRGPLEERSLRAILREVASGAHALWKPTKVAYLGPPYSYSHLATLERFGHSVDLTPVATIAAVFEEVHRGQASFGVVPLENSTDGRVTDTLDMFARRPLRICGEVQLRVHHHLLGRCPRAEVLEVYSKPQALSQCRSWLAKHLPAARPIEMTSTAAAAQVAAQKQGAAAIASRQAGQNYGLEVLAENIEDNQHNITRFAVIGGEAPSRSGHDKTALMFEIPHRPGALADVMAIFKRQRLNLTWIESFPLSGSRNEYLFFVEFEGHELDARAKRALAAMTRRTVRLDVLGSFAQSSPKD